MLRLALIAALAAGTASANSLTDYIALHGNPYNGSSGYTTSSVESIPYDTAEQGRSIARSLRADGYRYHYTRNPITGQMRVEGRRMVSGSVEFNSVTEQTINGVPARQWDRGNQ